MKKAYEGMFILPKSLNDDAVEEVLLQIRKEIERLDGSFDSCVRLGKKQFARPMAKQDCGYYAIIGFTMEGTSLTSLKAKLKLNDNVFRTQILVAPIEAPVVTEVA
ncbi:MAG: 30S ribosomal protein S6 [Spartobacteria bacterium]|nr:30S ribosomal protein S6 [Spartobacteria bacterium]